MSDPNLLPQNLRTQEQKEQERTNRHPQSLEISLTQPQSENKVSANFSTKPKSGFLEKLFGRPVSPVLTPALTNPSDLPMISGDNLLRPQKRFSARPPRNDIKPAPISPEKRASVWSQLFGQNKDKNQTEKSSAVPATALRPVKTTTTWTKAEPAVPLQPPRINQVQVKLPTNKKLAGDSWWNIVGALFGRNKKVDVPSHFASSAEEINGQKSKAPSAPLSTPELIPMPSPPSAPKEVVSPAEPPAKNDHSTYHLAPKRSRQSEVNVNLIPTELSQEQILDAGKIIGYLLVALCLSLVIVALGYGVIFWLNNNLLDGLKQQQTQLDQLTMQIKSYSTSDKQTSGLAAKVGVIKQLQSQKINWSNFFNQLEKYTLDGVYYNSLTADTSGDLLLPGVAGSYQTLAQQLAVFEGATDFLQEAKLVNAQSSAENSTTTSVGFKVKLKLQDKVFKF